MPAPELTLEKKRVLDLAFNHWEVNGEWPARKKAKFWLAEMGMGIEEADYMLSHDMIPLAHVDFNGTFELTVYGVAAAEGGEAWVKYFVPLVRKAVDLFTDDPKGEPWLTDVHLREIAKDEPEEKYGRIFGLYSDQLLSMGSVSPRGDDGQWHVQLSYKTWRYKNVESVWDFYERRSGNVKLSGEIGEDQRKMALWIYERWRQDGIGPMPIDVLTEHNYLANQLVLFENFPKIFFNSTDIQAHPNDPVTPSLHALIELRQETDEDLQALIHIICSIRDLFFEKESEAPTFEDVVQRTELPQKQVVRLLKLDSLFSSIGISIRKVDNDFKLNDIGNEIYELKEVNSVDDFISWFIEKEKNLGFGGGSMGDFGTWIVIEELGGGGQADVYLVKNDLNPDFEDQNYALKMLKDPDEKAIKRMKREWSILEILDHPNIMKPVDCNLESGEYWIVSEYCDGGNLTSLRLDDFSLLDRLSIFEKICKGVAYAHKKGVVHRDIKPWNIFLSENEKIPVVGDFGISYTSEEEERLTSTLESVGPKHYMAPELEDGRLDNILPNCDVYSLGKVLYWMVSSGRHLPREKHNKENFDLRPNYESGEMHLIYELFERTVVEEPNGRFSDAGELLAEVKVLKRRLEMKAHVVSLNAPQPCWYCGKGIYKIMGNTLDSNKSGKERNALRNLGFQIPFEPKILVMICNYCGNTQLFYPDKSENKYAWKK